MLGTAILRSWWLSTHNSVIFIYLSFLHCLVIHLALRNATLCWNGLSIQTPQIPSGILQAHFRWFSFIQATHLSLLWMSPGGHCPSQGSRPMTTGAPGSPNQTDQWIHGPGAISSNFAYMPKLSHRNQQSKGARLRDESSSPWLSSDCSPGEPSSVREVLPMDRKGGWKRPVLPITRRTCLP